MIWFVIGLALGILIGACGAAWLIGAGMDDDEHGRPRG